MPDTIAAVLAACGAAAPARLADAKERSAFALRHAPFRKLA
jgi:hypothetical protein